MLVTRACNPSYSGGRDRGSKPAQANSSGDPVSKISNTKKGWQSGSRGIAEALSSNPNTTKTNKKKNRQRIRIDIFPKKDTFHTHKNG
jgi:hypothetical protein